MGRSSWAGVLPLILELDWSEASLSMLSDVDSPRGAALKSN